MQTAKARIVGGAACVLAAASAAGCTPSGSQMAIIDHCQTPPRSASDPQVAGVLSAAQGRHYLDGTWLNGRQAVVMTVDVQTGSELPGSDSGCGQALLVGANVNVTTRDGVVAGQGTVLRFYDSQTGTMEVPLPGLDDAYAHPDPALAPLRQGWPAEDLLTDPTPTLILSFAGSSMAADLIVDKQRLVGAWSSEAATVPARQAAPYAVPADLSADCAPAADYTGAPGQYTMFATADDALAALAGNWIRCRAFGGPAHAGLQISPDGTWRTLSWQGGGFATQGGFQQEGFLEPPIAVSVNGAGAFQTNMRGPGIGHATHLWGDRLIVSDDNAPPALQEDVYIRTDRPAAITPNPYGTGQRAGAAACATPETGSLDPDLGAPMESMLAGDWTLCSGELLDGHAGLRFDGQGNVTLLASDGTTLGAFAYQALHPQTEPPTTPRDTVLLTPDEDWDILFSARPLKLWMSVTGTHTTARVAVFSPLP